MNDTEIRQLASDVVDGKVFGTWQLLNAPDMIPNVFMLLSLMGEQDFERVKQFAHLYEYLDKAGQYAINGYPCFLSFRGIGFEDFKTMWDYARELHDQRHAFLDRQPVADPSND